MTEKVKHQEKKRISLNSSKKKVIRTNYIKVKIDKTNRILNVLNMETEETVYDKMCKCNKLAQKVYKIRSDWVENVIHRDLYKGL